MNLTKIEYAVLFFSILTYLGVFVVVAPFSTDTVANDFKILTPIVIGLFGIYFARMQFKISTNQLEINKNQLTINNSKSKIDLFDKRFSIYESVYKLVSAVHDYSFYTKTGNKPYDINYELQYEKNRYKKIKDMIKDVDVKIVLAKVIISDEVAKNLKEYRDISVNNINDKYNSCFVYINNSYQNLNGFSDTAKQNDKILKEIVDTKLRADFEKYFTIK